MGLIKKLFGGGKKDESAKPVVGPVPPGAGDAAAEAGGGESALPMSPKQLIRSLGSGNEEKRAAAARQLGELKNRSAMRPLMNAYLNYGDADVLDALKRFAGDALASAATREAFDMSVMGPRRARLMDIIGITGTESALPAVRENIDDDDLDIHIRSAVAMARLGDNFGVDRLAEDIRLNAPETRTAAISALQEIDSDRSRLVLSEHVQRYVAEKDAVPDEITVAAPMMTAPDSKLVDHVCKHIQANGASLTVVVGTGGINIATNQREAIKNGLPGSHFEHALLVMTPEEQISALKSARSVAASGSSKAVFCGRLPAPHDSPPLPHFLEKAENEYSAEILIVDPGEYSLLQNWYQLRSGSSRGVPTKLSVILGNEYGRPFGDDRGREKSVFLGRPMSRSPTSRGHS